MITNDNVNKLSSKKLALRKAKAQEWVDNFKPFATAGTVPEGWAPPCGTPGITAADSEDGLPPPTLPDDTIGAANAAAQRSWDGR